MEGEAVAVLDDLYRGVIVSCQALEDEPLHGPMLMAAMARAAALGGAAGIRTNGVYDVEVCKKITNLPVIGIWKTIDATGNICITPTFRHAQALAEAGSDIVAVDVRQPKKTGEPLEELLPRIRQELQIPIMADCATLAEAENPLKIGVDIISPTFGFKQNKLGIEPNFSLLDSMTKLSVPVFAEGWFW